MHDLQARSAAAPPVGDAQTFAAPGGPVPLLRVWILASVAEDDRKAVIEKAAAEAGEPSIRVAGPVPALFESAT
jgi:hypothetical protein